jgi:hypothetical protein
MISVTPSVNLAHFFCALHSHTYSHQHSHTGETAWCTEDCQIGDQENIIL